MDKEKDNSQVDFVFSRCKAKAAEYQKLRKMSAEAWDEARAASEVFKKAKDDYDEKFQKALAIDEELRWRTEKYI